MNQQNGSYAQIKDTITKEYSERAKKLWKRALWKLRMVKMMSLAKESIYYDEKLKKFTSKSIIKDEPTIVKSGIGRTVFSPQGAFYSIWLATVSLVLIYLATGDPFISSFLELEGNENLRRLDIAIDLIFLVDFMVTLNLAYYDEDGSMVLDRKKIILHYAKGWMFLDLCSSIPLGIIGYSMGTHNSSRNLIRMVRLRNIPKLFRLAKLIKIITNFSMFEDLDYILSKYNKELRFMKVMLIVFCCIHITACLFYLAAKFDNFDPETWAYRYHQLNGEYLNDIPVEERYVAALYWSITTLGTIGYGDIVPKTVFEKLLAMFWMVIGVYVVSYSVGSLTSFYTDLNIKDNIKHDRIIMAEDFAKKVGIPKSFLHKVKRTIKFMDIQPNKLEQDKLFQGIPLSLRLQVSQNIHLEGIRKIPFFSGKEEIFIADIALRLEAVTGVANDVIWQEKEAADGIFFIIEGKVRLSHNGTVFTTMQVGYSFGDIEVVSGSERIFKVQAMENYKFLKMNKDLIERVQEIYPLVWKEIKESSKKRLKNLLQNLAEMILIIKLNCRGVALNFGFSECKQELDDLYQKLYLDAQPVDKKNFKVKMKNRLESTGVSIANISDMVDILFT